MIHRHPDATNFAGTAYKTQCTNATASATAIVLPELSGYGDDYFNNHYYIQVLKANHELLTIDSAPTPSEWAAGATLTGATSLETCLVVTKLTSTTYVVKSRSGTFTDGEVVSDGTNSRDCGAGYPLFTTGAAPEHEVRKVTDYVSTTGTFTTDAFSSTVEMGDQVLVLHESIVAIGRDDSNNTFASTNVVSNADGSVLERLEWIQTALGGTASQLRILQSATGTVEETDIVRFAVSLMDMDSGAIASANINITSITQTMERSRNGSAYSPISDPTVAFSKADGLVYMDYEFKAAEWQVGDMYRMSLSGITCTIAGDTAYVPAMIWNNIVVEAEDLTNNTQYLYGVADGGTTYPTKVIDNSILSIIMTKQSGGDTSDFDNSTDSLEAIADAISDLHTDVADIHTDVADVDSDVSAVALVIADIHDVDLPDVHTDVNTTLGYVDHIYAVADGTGVYPASAVDDSIVAKILGKGSTASASTYDNQTDSLEMISDKLGGYTGDGGTDQGDSVLADLTLVLSKLATGAGAVQMVATTESLNQIAGSYDLFTGTTQAVVLEGLSVKMPTGAAGGAITSISVQTDDATPAVIISSALGAVANLTSEAELSWTGFILVNVGTKIQLTIAGGAHGSDYSVTVVAKYRAVVAGGTLVA